MKIKALYDLLIETAEKNGCKVISSGYKAKAKPRKSGTIKIVAVDENGNCLFKEYKGAE